MEIINFNITPTKTIMQISDIGQVVIIVITYILQTQLHWYYFINAVVTLLQKQGVESNT